MASTTVSIAFLAMSFYILLSSCNGQTVETATTTTAPVQTSPQVLPPHRRPSMWSRTVQNMQEDGLRKIRKYKRPFLRRSTEMRPVEDNSISYKPMLDEEAQFLQSDSILSLRDFANQLVNETAALMKASPQPRSYPGTSVAAEDPVPQQTQQFWDEKDQAYHASSYTGLDYEAPTSYHHPFPHHPPPVHYYTTPQKKDDTLFTKVALLALLKLILAKLKAIGFLKVLLVVMLKVPIFFFKMLIAFKGFKFLKLLSIPFLIAAFALPLLPVIPFFMFAFLPFLLAIPLFLPLLLPLLLFLPIVPVTTPATAAGRKKREIPMQQSVTANQTWSPLDEMWKNERTKKTFRTRARPVSSPRRSGGPHLSEEHNSGLIELTQRVIQSQQCMERAACELASYNDSKIYQSAVMWALGKLHTYAPVPLQRKIEQYTHAYEKGVQRSTSNFCGEKFICARPKVFLVQGHHTYNVI